MEKCIGVDLLLDNYKEVIEHGIKVFGDKENLPSIDIENITYTSKRYARLNGIKRAYRIPKDPSLNEADNTSQTRGWLITIELMFDDPHKKIIILWTWSIY